MRKLISLRELKCLIHPHYIINILLACSFLVLRKTAPLCNYLFEEGEDGYCSQLLHRESELLFFTAAVIVFRTRKVGAVSLLPYLSTACMFAKLGSCLLYFYSDPIYGVIFMILCLLHLILLPEPSYKGPEKITYFKATDLDLELKNADKIWMVELYTTWNPACIDFSSIFAELSANFTLNNLKFGKIDLSRNPETGEKYKINTTPLSKQLPTLIMFNEGKEMMRRPLVQRNGKLVSFAFNYENVVNEFNLDQIYKECQQKLKTPKKAITQIKKDN